MPETTPCASEIMVIGGGLAGVCAALAAARQGAQTMLVQDRPVLGGNSSSEIRVHVTGADGGGSRPGYREGGLLEELRLEEAVRNPQRAATGWDLILWEKVMAEPNLTLLLNTHVHAVEKSGERIARVHARRLTTEEDLLLEGRLFVDCTGHATLGALAGADFAQGREGPEQYGEPHAEGPDGKTMGASLMWCARDVGRPVPFLAPAWARRFERPEDLPHRLGPGLSLEHGHWWIEYGGELDVIREAEHIRDELIACLMGVWDWVKNRSGRAAENWALEWWGFLPGHRESRRLLGPQVLTEVDLLENRTWTDTVAHGGWPLDTHPPGGIFAPEPPCSFLHTPEVYGIPLRCLYSRNVPNLFMAGRNASCTHMAMSSTRVMGTCAVMGQAVGTAAARCAAQDCEPGELSPAQVAAVQEDLLRDDQYLPGRAAADPRDLARRAEVSASSSAPGCPPAAVLSGVAREVAGVSHQWRSAEGAGLPQTLELTWPEAVELREVHLTFDSGFERPLCLTHNDGFTQKMIRGPQPETVRDYTLQARVEGQWVDLHREQGNYQRKRVHMVRPVRAEALRLVVEATQGVHQARVFELRVY